MRSSRPAYAHNCVTLIIMANYRQLHELSIIVLHTVETMAVTTTTTFGVRQNYAAVVVSFPHHPRPLHPD